MSKKKTKSSVKKVSKPAKKAAAIPSKTAKKPAKKLNKVAKAKPVAKKLVKAKPAKTKKPAAKKLSKPVKKLAAKKAVKKVSKPVKKAVAKKVMASRSSAIKIKKVVEKFAKPVKKAVAKKTVKKVAPKKAVKAVKKLVVKTPAPKVKAVVIPSQKPLEVKTVAPKPVVAKKQAKEAPKPQATATPTLSKQEQIIKVLAGNSAEKTQNEPAGKFELEYVIHSSASILFEFLTSPSGLSEWFCDDVNIRNENCSFVWDGVEQKAKLVKFIEEKLVRFQWEDKGDGSYFEFRIEKDDLTNDISLMVTDFAETAEERESSKLLWDSQIEQLMKVLGSY